MKNEYMSMLHVAEQHVAATCTMHAVIKILLSLISFIVTYFMLPWAEVL